MGTLPLPANLFFADFKDELQNFSVIRNGNTITTAKGMKDNNEVMFLFGTDVCVGDTLKGETDLLSVVSIRTESFNGQPQAISAICH